ncbi:putative antirestriction adenine methyltransferase [Streptomyces antimycoticus]|uniref:putative antirestriction adenine methyltransferase n=1 Tax=Streptomyces antimycoticus TaxID=68175 RepID=UPI0036A3D9BC
MFQGTIPGPMRAIVRETAGRWPRGEVYVPCCGNFTIERSVAGMGFALHSSDVSIYTTAIGRWLTRQSVGIRLREESRDHLGWLADSLDDGVGTVATLMLGTRFLASVGRQGLWHERVVRSYRDQWDAKHAETVRRLSGSDVELASYEVEDVRSWLQKVPRDAPVCSFPPFYGGGYEKLYEPLNEHFVWDAHEYEPLSDADVVDVLGAITDRPYWLTASNHDVPDLHPYLRGVVKATPRAAPFYVYASEAPTRIVTPRQPIEPVKAPRLRRGDEVVRPIKLAMLKPGQFNALRSRYLNPRIAPGAANLAVAVKDGSGRILGVFALAPSSYTPDEAYLLSDFAVAPTDYPRLSKLVVLAAMSSEAQLMCQRAFSRRIRAVSTTAFSDNPVSMKYRGLLRLTKRGPSNEDGWKFQLQYQGAMGEHSLAEALEKWAKRWGARTTQTEV